LRIIRQGDGNSMSVCVNFLMDPTKNARNKAQIGLREEEEEEDVR